MILAAEIMFYLAFVIDLVIVYFGYRLYRGIKGSSLGNVALFTSLSAFIFGLHHLGEIWFEAASVGIVIAESLEAVAALLFLIAAYYIYRASREVFVAEKYEIKND